MLTECEVHSFKGFPKIKSRITGPHQHQAILKKLAFICLWILIALKQTQTRRCVSRDPGTIKMDSNMMQCADEPRYQTSEKHHLCWWILYQWHRFRLNKASTDGLMIMTVSLHKERYRHATDSTDSCKQFSGMTTVNVTQKPAVTRENHQECQPESVCGNHWTQAMNAKH